MNSLSKGTINNPFNINFLGIRLPASTGEQGSGAKLLNFLDQVILGKREENGKELKITLWQKCLNSSKQKSKR